MIETLVLNDIRYIKKDPMYMIVFILPIILGCVYKFLLLNIDFIKPYIYVAKYLFTLIVPVMVGMLLGFRVLEEKDEKVISVYATGPLGIKGYVNYRLFQSLILGLIEVMILSLFGIISEYNFIFTIIISVLLSPCIFLILAIMGKNKIQGMILLKLVGIFTMIPILQVIKDNKWDVLFKIIPTDFILNSNLGNSASYMGIIYIVEIIIAMIVMISYFYKKCLKDI